MFTAAPRLQLLPPTPAIRLPAPIALVADDLTRACIRHSAPVIDMNPWAMRWTLKRHRPSLLLVESAWQGHGDRWKYRIARYADHPTRSNALLRRLVYTARDLGIPTVFWNKEDGVHFDRFIDSACLFDAVFTVDENCLSRYRERLAPDVHLGALPFAVQPAIHFPGSAAPRVRRACFVGSYGRHIHPGRRRWQDMMFQAASALGINAFDRNHRRRAAHYRFPELPWMSVHAGVPHVRTAGIYRDHLVSINVNTVDDSPTMLSRRLLEIVACGGLAVTSPSPAIERLLAGCCNVVHDAAQAREVFDRLARDGLSPTDRERALAGADHVRRHHTWAHRLDTILGQVAR